MLPAMSLQLIIIILFFFLQSQIGECTLVPITTHVRIRENILVPAGQDAILKCSTSSGHRLYWFPGAASNGTSSLELADSTQYSTNDSSGLENPSYLTLVGGNPDFAAGRSLSFRCEENNFNVTASEGFIVQFEGPPSSSCTLNIVVLSSTSAQLTRNVITGNLPITYQILLNSSDNANITWSEELQNTTETFECLQPGISYNVYCTPSNAAGTGPSSVTSFTLGGGEPTDLVACRVSDSCARLSLMIMNSTCSTLTYQVMCSSPFEITKFIVSFGMPNMTDLYYPNTETKLTCEVNTFNGSMWSSNSATINKQVLKNCSTNPVPTCTLLPLSPSKSDLLTIEIDFPWAVAFVVLIIAVIPIIIILFMFIVWWKKKKTREIIKVDVQNEVIPIEPVNEQPAVYDEQIDSGQMVQNYNCGGFNSKAFMDKFSERFLEDVSSHAIVGRLEIKKVISKGVAHTIKHRAPGNEELFLHLRNYADPDSISKLCDVMRSIPGHPRMNKLGKAMKEELDLLTGCQDGADNNSTSIREQSFDFDQTPSDIGLLAVWKEVPKWELPTNLGVSFTDVDSLQQEGKDGIEALRIWQSGRCKYVPPTWTSLLNAVERVEGPEVRERLSANVGVNKTWTQ